MRFRDMQLHRAAIAEKAQGTPADRNVMHACVEARGFTDQFKVMVIAKYLGNHVARFIKIATLQYREVLQGVSKVACSFQLTLQQNQLRWCTFNVSTGRCQIVVNWCSGVAAKTGFFQFCRVNLIVVKPEGKFQTSKAFLPLANSSYLGRRDGE